MLVQLGGKGDDHGGVEDVRVRHQPITLGLLIAPLACCWGSTCSGAPFPPRELTNWLLLFLQASSGVCLAAVEPHVYFCVFQIRLASI
jgi:hypothetical protein